MPGCRCRASRRASAASDQIRRSLDQRRIDRQPDKSAVQQMSKFARAEILRAVAGIPRPEIGFATVLHIAIVSLEILRKARGANAAFRMRGGRARHRLDKAGFEPIVRRGRDDMAAARLIEPAVQCVVDARVAGVAQQAQLRQRFGEPFDHGDAVIGRRVVDDEDLVRRPRLCRQCLQRAADKTGVIVVGDQNGYGRRRDRRRAVLPGRLKWRLSHLTSDFIRSDRHLF
jgi:hypothetical protein